MERHEFSSYDHYQNAQIRLVRKKLKKEPDRCWVSIEILERIASLRLESHPVPSLGVCHGVRTGRELEMFEKVFGGGKWLGTEITPELCDGISVFNRDFSDPWSDIQGKADLVYSNSLDHARDPQQAILVWGDQLSPEGWLCVEWSPWHGKLGQRGNLADCFAASRDEYRMLLSGSLRLVEEIEMEFLSKRGNPYSRVVFIVEKG